MQIPWPEQLEVAVWQDAFVAWQMGRKFEGGFAADWWRWEAGVEVEVEVDGRG